MTTVFVTASGTGVGKTFVTTRLIAELSAANRRVQALKPVASGFDAAAPAGSDAGGRALAAPAYCNAATTTWLPVDIFAAAWCRISADSRRRGQEARRQDPLPRLA